MYRLLILGILIISPLPLHAQGQQPNIAKLKADAQRVVSIISGDKAKAQTYCQINNLVDQIGEAEAGQVDHPQKGKDRPFHDSRSPPNACYSIYPLVTTGAAGGGAFPLPTYCAQPATLRRVNAAAVTRASVFMAPSFNAKSVTDGLTRPLVLKTL
jgi:hypothetical protein